MSNDKKRLIIIAASIAGFLVIVGAIVGALGKASTESFMCSHIGDRYINENIYESDVESAKFFKCPQKTFDRLSEKKRIADKERAEEEAEYQKYLAESAKKKAECEAQDKVYSSNWECMTQEEAAERQAKEEERKAKAIEEQKAKKAEEQAKKDAEEAEAEKKANEEHQKEQSNKETEIADVSKVDMYDAIAFCESYAERKLGWPQIKVIKSTIGATVWSGVDYVAVLTFEIKGDMGIGYGEQNLGRHGCKYNWNTKTVVDFYKL